VSRLLQASLTTSTQAGVARPYINQMSANGTKRKWRPPRVMSAFRANSDKAPAFREKIPAPTPSIADPSKKFPVLLHIKFSKNFSECRGLLVNRSAKKAHFTVN
jgi:hypothetical protein